MTISAFYRTQKLQFNVPRTYLCLIILNKIGRHLYLLPLANIGLFKWNHLAVTSFSTTTLVHSFVASRLDYCSCLYTGLPATRLSCLDRVLRSAARLIGRIPKYDHISTYMLDILHWLPARQRIEYRMAALVWRCLLGLAPAYLVEFWLKVHGALAPSVQPIKVFSVYHLHAPPPGRNVPLQWLAPQFGMASLCRSAHSLELFLRHSFLN